MADKKYYWLKLNKDFFNRSDIKIIEDMDNGKDYVLFYLKLMLESISHNGELRFNETIPYNEKMLSTITNTNLDIVRSAMKLFTSMGMVEIMDDATIYISEVEKMIGSAADNDNANRQRRFRENQKQVSIEGGVTKSNAGVTERNENNNESKSIDIDKELELERELEIDNKPVRQKRFRKPTVEEIESYCRERNNNVDANKFYDYYESKGWIIGKSPMKDWKACVRTWERNNYGSSYISNKSDNPFDNIE